VQRVARIVATKGGLEGYRALANDDRIAELGPAFGTKYLTFCPQAPDQRQALVLDRLVSSWLTVHTYLSVTARRWSTPAYDRYLTELHAWASELGVDPLELELRILSAAA
jgi:hypothetical protein